MECKCTEAMSECLIHPHTKELWTASMQDFLVSHLVLPENEKGLATSGNSLGRLFAVWMPSDPNMFSSKTSLDSLQANHPSANAGGPCTEKSVGQVHSLNASMTAQDSTALNAGAGWYLPTPNLFGTWEQYKERWPREGIVCNGSAYLPSMSGLHIKGIVGGVLPYPATLRPAIEKQCMKDGSHPEQTEQLFLDREIYPTPTAAHKEGCPSEILRRSPSLASVATMKMEREMYPTPTVCGDNNAKKAGTNRGDGLATVVKRKEGIAAALGRLNPEWVEWLMNWPAGFTDPTGGKENQKHQD